jgi:hypothetical protein
MDESERREDIYGSVLPTTSGVSLLNTNVTSIHQESEDSDVSINEYDHHFGKIRNLNFKRQFLFIVFYSTGRRHARPSASGN